jgi:hypothetical protein
MLLLLTSSTDGTADLLAGRLQSNLFRLNYDLLDEYEIEFGPAQWRVTDPTGRSITSTTCQRAFWWKAFSAWRSDLDKMLLAEHKYFFKDLYGLLAYEGKVVGNPPDWHNRLGKMGVLHVAAQHMPTPTSLVTMKLAGAEALTTSSIVAKSLSSALTSTNKALFTTEVSLNQLHPGYLWFLQSKIESRWDVTVFLCDGKLFPFRRDRASLKGIDWRAEQSFDVDSSEWEYFDLSSTHADPLRRIASELGVEFGRFDLMSEGDSEELVFLEYNANGQWVFLDYHNRHGLLDAVVSWLTKGLALKP